MFFYISKFMSFLLMPYTQMCIWFILAVSLKKKSLKRTFLFLGLAYLFFFSNRFIVNEMLLAWEIAPTPFEQLDDNYEVGIVLGGITNSEKEPRDRVYFHKGADRIVHAFQLYKLGKIRKILVSGGSGSIIRDTHREADNLYAFLILCGVPPDDIILEDDARNTYENATLSAEILFREYPGKRHLVITSAVHLRRSLLCFRKQHVDADGFSTDFYTKTGNYVISDFLVPDPAAFKDWHMLLHELFGLLIYKVAGYI